MYFGSFPSRARISSRISGIGVTSLMLAGSILVVPVEGLPSQRLPVQIYLRVQLLHVRLRRLLHAHQLLFVLVCLRPDVRRIRVQDRSAHENLLDALPQNLIEDLLRNVVVPELPQQMILRHHLLLSFFLLVFCL